MRYKNIYRSTFLIIFPVGLLIFIFSYPKMVNEFFGGLRNAEIENKITLEKRVPTIERKQRGVHVFGHFDSINLQPFVRNNFEWITIVPYGAQKDFNTSIYARGNDLRRIRRDSVRKSQIEVAHAAGFKVFLKPHIWLTEPSDGKWRSDIFPENEKDWKLWKKTYREFILRYAKIAEQKEVELFCVGTELSRLSVEKSDFWVDLIKEVRSIYSGKITYAANWYDEFEKITFWEELDFIGIQAYFPLTQNENPTIQQISEGWNQHLPAIKSIHEKYNRKILFTEMGYKSTSDSAVKPWDWIDYSSDSDKPVSTTTQVNCYQAFFDTVWNQEWFAGVHIWQMRSDFVKGRGKSDLDFTPQGKPAEGVIAKGFE